ncbi:MAG: hypothetical protein OXT72_03175 [Gammaproteobacteria bacterium]|nr:hypothetical protein [Gammaproteobacteria bacterium]MDE0249260.1 hypothetical protein [Gammaproteobacteria bacterium]
MNTRGEPVQNFPIASGDSGRKFELLTIPDPVADKIEAVAKGIEQWMSGTNEGRHTVS